MLCAGRSLNRRLVHRSFSSSALPSQAASRYLNQQKLCLALSAASVVGLVYYQTSKSVVRNESPLTPAEVNLRNIGGQKSSLTSEGWGSNKLKTLRPGDSEDVIKTPSTLSWLDNIALRDLVLHETHAACIDARGDVYQWGGGLFDSERSPRPVMTLRGKNIKQLTISSNRIVALSDTGQVYVLSTTQTQPVSSSSGGWGFWDTGDAGGSIELTPQYSLPRGEKFISISAGDDHLLALTSAGRTFTHPFTKDANAYGQLGLRHVEMSSTDDSSNKRIELIPKAISDPYALSTSRKRAPPASETDFKSVDPNDISLCRTLFEIPALKGIQVSQIAAGSRSSFVNTASGRVLGWGANEFGQIGLGDNVILSTITVPTEVVLWRNVSRKTSSRCVGIHAGGDLTLFTVERRDGTSFATIDVLACGNGQAGSLGNAVYTNAQSNPVRIKNVSGLTEYSERTNNMQPIHPHAISVSPAGHVLLTLDTLTRATGIYGGRDLIVWGANYDFQLGTGKRSSLASATQLHRPDGSRYMLLKAKADVVNDMRGGIWKRNVDVEQTAVAGFGNSIVYWKII